MMVLGNTLTNIYRNSAYTDEMHSLIMQAVAVVAGQSFRVQFTALQKALSPCVIMKMVEKRVLSIIAQIFNWSVSVACCVEKDTAVLNTPLDIHAACFAVAKTESFLYPFCTQSWRKTNFLIRRDNCLLLEKMSCIMRTKGQQKLL